MGWPKLTIVQKLIGYCLIVSVLPILVVGWIAYYYATKELGKQSDLLARTLLNKEERLLSAYLEQVEALTSQIAGLEDIAAIMEEKAGEDASYDTLVTNARIGYLLNRFLNVRGLLSISLFGDQGAYYHVGDTLQVSTLEAERVDDLKNRALSQPYSVYWPGIESNFNTASSEELVLPVVRILRVLNPDSLALEPIGMIVVYLSVDAFYQTFSETSLGPGSFLAVLDHQNRLVFHPDRARLGSSGLDIVPADKLEGSETRFEREFDGDKHVINLIDSQITGWKMASVVQSHTIESTADTIRTVTILLIVTSLSFVALAAWRVSRTMVQPMQAIVERFKRFRSRDLDVAEPLEVKGNDEVSELVRWYNEFLKTLRLRQEFEAELETAKQEAEEANKAKSQFLASMSHELRTPMNAVLGFAQMLQYDPTNPLSEKQKEYVGTILSAGQHLLELINEVLDLSRIEANQQDLVLEEVTAGEIIEECVTLSAPLGEARRISIEAHGIAPEIVFKTDHRRLRQVLLNLLSNGVKYNRDGGSVRVEAEERPGDYGRITVTDTGLGIAKEDFPKVFQMFTRFTTDAMIAREGSGIGLTVSQLLVERMAGRIGFDSEEGRGSTFWIELPLARKKDILIWTEDLRIQIDALDKDHQALVELTNKISRPDLSSAQVEILLNKLKGETRDHFVREEAIMAALGDPNFEQHSESHAEHLRILADFCDRRLTSRDGDEIEALLGNLKSWWTHHIHHADKDIVGLAEGRAHDIREALRHIEAVAS
ncbi:MAG: ATP-binding protein [Magnetovibrionaceae bacterium]